MNPVTAEAATNPAPASAPAPEASPAPEVNSKTDALAEACARARGEVAIPGDEAPVGKWTVARKEYSTRGRCREHWFRMVYRGDQWTYLGERIGGPGGFRASERRQSSEAELWLGELVARHDRGGPIVTVSVVGPASDGNGYALRKCEFVRTRDGNLKITLPDGSVITRPDPRR